MPTIKKLYFASGTDVTAPTDLSAATSTTHIGDYADDAAFVTANGTATSGDLYNNTTLRALRLYTGSAWRTVIMSADDADATKTFLVDIDGATTGTSATLDFNQTASRVYTFPDTAGIVVINSNSLTSPTILSGATGTTTVGNASGTVVFAGNVTVSGTTTTVNSTTLVVADKNIFISSGGNDAASEGAGLTVDRTSTDGSLIYKDASATKWAAGAAGAEVDVVGTSSTQTLTNKTISGASNTLSNVNLASQVTGNLPLTNGGLGASHASANAALNTLLPSQATNATKYLQTDGTNTSWQAVTGGSSSTDPMQANNYSLANSVAANALTIALKNAAGNDPTAPDPVEIAFRSATAATGTYSVVQTTAAQSIVVASGASLGHGNNIQAYFYVYQINNAGAGELAVSSKLFDEGTIVSTTAMSGAATSSTVMYSTTARTNVACRLIARLSSTQTTAGTWAAVPTEISLGNSGRFTRNNPSAIRVATSDGFGGTSSGEIAIRNYSTVIQSVGSAITRTARTTTVGEFYTINEPGIYTIHAMDNAADGATFGISLNTNQPSTNISSITAADRVSIASCGGGAYNQIASATLYLKKGDIIRSHTNQSASTTAAEAQFHIAQLMRCDHV